MASKVVKNWMCTSFIKKEKKWWLIPPLLLASFLSSPLPFPLYGICKSGIKKCVCVYAHPLFKLGRFSIVYFFSLSLSRSFSRTRWCQKEWETKERERILMELIPAQPPLPPSSAPPSWPVSLKRSNTHSEGGRIRTEYSNVSKEREWVYIEQSGAMYCTWGVHNNKRRRGFCFASLLQVYIDTREIDWSYFAEAKLTKRRGRDRALHKHTQKVKTKEETKEEEEEEEERSLP